VKSHAQDICHFDYTSRYTYDDISVLIDLEIDNQKARFSEVLAIRDDEVEGLSGIVFVLKVKEMIVRVAQRTIDQVGTGRE
jgi:hypothetical protein